MVSSQIVMSPIEFKAWQVANNVWHIGQANPNRDPHNRWLRHCGEVVRVLLMYGINDPELLAAAWLHDSIEDYSDILAKDDYDHVPESVWTIVRAVTDEPGPNRKARKALTYPKIRATPGATLVKLADRIANVSECIRMMDHRLQMYVDEHDDFREALLAPSDDRRELALWRCLEGLVGRALVA